MLDRIRSEWCAPVIGSAGYECEQAVGKVAPSLFELVLGLLKSCRCVTEVFPKT